jgi:hypothetical protein
LARGSRGSVNKTIDTFLLCLGIAGSGVYWSVVSLSMNIDIIQRVIKKTDPLCAVRWLYDPLKMQLERTTPVC